MDVALVSGRECGECHVCCKAVAVYDEELVKPPGELCHNYKMGVGCGIHVTRPGLCRAFFCGWRMMGNFGDDWRPDRSGVLIKIEQEDIPENFAMRAGVRFFITDREKAVAHPAFAAAIGNLIAQKVPMFLTLLSYRGSYAANVLLNDAVGDAVAQGNVALVHTQLVALLDRLEAEGPKSPVTPKGN